MKLSFAEYKDKVRACWLGKNIGGTLGAPFEGKRGVFDVTGYTHDVSKGALPNDDLDLQLVFLRAAEEYGRKLTSAHLGEYWLNQIVAHWSEYGTGKSNMRIGLVPPLSGKYLNPMGNSCGCFIRSEIWACLAPGHPEIAAKYAFEDAMVDHADEGLYGEVFTAALEAAAFVESDPDKLIDIAASYIPKDSAVSGAVKLVQKCYKEGKTWRQARSVLLNTYPDSFCGWEMELPPEDTSPVGEFGFDAPANIGIATIGWYYGEGDFGKSLCIAASCGEDADCTCATLGSVFGIIGGTKSIPAEWVDPIGEDIKTLSVDLTVDHDQIPTNITDLTTRVTRLMPTFIGADFDLENLTINTRDNLFDKDMPYGFGSQKTTFWNVKEELKLRQPWTVTADNAVYNAYLDFGGNIEISEGEEKEIKLFTHCKIARTFFADVIVNAPQDWEVLPTRESVMRVNPKLHGWLDEHTIKIVPHNLTKGIYRFSVEVHITDRPSSAYLPVVLIVK